MVSRGDNTKELSERLKEWWATQSRFKSKRDLASQAGIGYTSLKEYFRGTLVPQRDNAAKLYAITRIDCLNLEQPQSIFSRGLTGDYPAISDTPEDQTTTIEPQSGGGLIQDPEPSRDHLSMEYPTGVSQARLFGDATAEAPPKNSSGWPLSRTLPSHLRRQRSWTREHSSAYMVLSNWAPHTTYSHRRCTLGSNILSALWRRLKTS